jgi:hypothetical protein
MTFRHLITGHDTIECAYYLAPIETCLIDFQGLAVQKDELSRAKSRKPKAIQLGTEEFLLASHGTASGYPLLIENDVFSIEFGEFNKPNYFVTFRSRALWHYGAFNLHQRFLTWAASMGLMPYRPEGLSRVDFTFDYHLPVMNFDENDFVSQAKKDNQHRKDGKLQTLRFGSDQVVLRIYNKCDEINESSAKTWFYPIWGIEQDVWRIEWQIRKQFLKYFEIRTFEDLNQIQGDLLRFLVKEHTSLRVKTNDTNRSRWPMHPLWQDLIDRVNQMDGLGITRNLDTKALLEERLTRIAISVYGYAKRVAAIDLLYRGQEKSYVDEAFRHLENRILELHDPLTWDSDVKKRVEEMRLGE